MDLAGGSWGIITIVAPLLLAAVLLWTLMRNRKSRVDVDRSERATHDAYDREEEARQRDDGGA